MCGRFTLRSNLKAIATEFGLSGIMELFPHFNIAPTQMVAVVITPDGLSLINAGLAQSNGRSGFLWWLASIFIGPLATLLIVILPQQASRSS